MKNKLIMKYPSSWHNDMWREAAPAGNGLIGISVYGGIKKEMIMLNHAYLWKGGFNDVLPDVSDHLATTRKFLADNDPIGADGVLSGALNAKGYNGRISTPLPLGDISVYSHTNKIANDYRRIIDMENATVTVTWTEAGVRFTRQTFVSRVNDLIFTKISCEEKNLDLNVGLLHHDDETLGNYVILDEEIKTTNKHIYYACRSDSQFSSGDYGGVMKVITDGETEDVVRFERGVAKTEIHVKNTDEIIMVTRLFLKSDRTAEFTEIDGEFNYDEELAKHTEIHKKAYTAVDFSITDKDSGDTSNEELLIDAYDKGSSNELIEKLYAYGRYLFICSTREKDTLPVHLVGLWSGSYVGMWAFYMYNVNYQLMYWQSLTGNMAEYLRNALEYTWSQMDDYRENAKKLFNCRGIYISSTNTPESGLSKAKGNHLLNWTVGAAWFAQHYWEYYMYTNDIDYLKEKTMPFMYEAALFFEDFLFLDESGKYVFSPSVSPENSASNVYEITHTEKEVCVNATMDIATVKELLTNLLKGAEITGMYNEKIDTWKDMLSKLPEYRINKDGAIKEWTHDFYEDNYNHRHHSHIYPVFPGREIKRGHELYPAFEKAEDLRFSNGLSDQSSWSMVFMACISARMAKGDRALEIIDTMARTCLINNFFTLHNDWRRTGAVYCDDFRRAPFQMDGNLGVPAAINEMLLCSDEDHIEVLPALPTAWKTGHINGLLTFYGAVCDVEWNEKTVILTVNCAKEMDRKIIYKDQTQTLKLGGETKITFNI